VVAAGLLLCACADSPLAQLRLNGYPPAVREQIAKARQRAEDHPLDAAELGALGITLLAYQMDETALRCFRQARDLDNGSGKWSFFEGLILQQWRRHNEAAAAFASSLRANPGNFAVRLRLGDSLAESREWRQSEDVFQAALDLDQSSARAHYGLARALEALGRRDDAIAAYSQACKAFSGYSEARRALARLLETKGDSKEAAEQRSLAALTEGEPPLHDPLWQRVLDEDKGPSGLTRSAAEALTRGDPRQAVERLRVALELDPHHLAAHALLISAYSSTGEFSKAAHHYEAALEISPFEPGVHLKLGEVLFRHRNYVDAAAAFRRAEHAAPDSPSARLMLAEALLEAGDATEAERHFQAIRIAHGESPRAARGLGLILADRRRYEEAIPLLEQARGLPAPYAQDVAEMLAEAYRFAGRGRR
jgi:tetratricopeptide (TPR) repeat protein